MAGQQPQGPLTLELLGDGWEFGKLEPSSHTSEMDRVDFKPVTGDWETFYGGSKVDARASWKTGEVPGLALPARAIVHDEHKSATVMRVGTMSDEENKRASSSAESEVWEDVIPEEKPVTRPLANTSAEKAKEMIESPSQRYYGVPELRTWNQNIWRPYGRSVSGLGLSTIHAYCQAICDIKLIQFPLSYSSNTNILDIYRLHGIHGIQGFYCTHPAFAIDRGCFRRPSMEGGEGKSVEEFE